MTDRSPYGEAAIAAAREEGRKAGLREAAQICELVGRDNFAPVVRSFDEAFSASAGHCEREILALLEKDTDHD